MTPTPLTPIERFRRTLDAAVAAARAAVVAGGVGRAAAAASAAIVVLSAADLWLQWSGFWPGGTIVAALVGLVVWQLLRSRRKSWPNRLRIALAAEATRPELGERLSRAVDFLDGTPRPRPAEGPSAGPPAAADAFVTRALESLAVEQAASAIPEGDSLPMPGARRELVWAVAGLAAITVVWFSAVVQPRPWGECVARQLVPLAAHRRPAAGSGAPAGSTRTSAGGTARQRTTVAPTIPAATANAWRRIEAMLRLVAAAAGNPEAAVTTLGALQTPLARATAESRAALAAAPSDVGASVLRRVVAELSDLERRLTTTVDPPTQRLDAAHRSLESLAAMARASAGIADAAVFQTRLAAILADRFGRHPGLRREELPSSIAGELDHLASLQADCLADVAADIGTVRAGAGKDLLDLLDVAVDGIAGGDWSTGWADWPDITDNRLAIAAAAATRRAAALERVADRLGMPAARREDRPPPAGSRMLRSMAELGRLLPKAARDIGSEAAVADDGVDGGTAATPTDRPPSARPSSVASGSATETRKHAARGQAGDDGGMPAADGGVPGPGGPTTDRQAAVAEAGRRQQRIWNLLPPRGRPAGVRAADVPVAADYRAAVDDYYRSLLEGGRPAEGTP